MRTDAVFHLAAGILFLLSSPAPGQESALFPGLPWGVSLQQARRAYPLELVSRETAVERYGVVVGRLGEADIHDCLFEFTGGRFSGIVLTTRGSANTRALYRYLAERFGTGSDDGHRFWQWMAGDTYVSLDEDSAGDGYVLWYRIPIDN